MKNLHLLGVSVMALVAAAAPAMAQSTSPGDAASLGAAPTAQGNSAPPSAVDAPAQASSSDTGIADIVVTAQRQSQRLQDVPISVSAFTAEALQQQQIENSSDLQLSLPNITFTKTNFTASSFTIRGIGDLCTGFSCDAATGVHINDVPVPATRLFETEYLDLERVEVLRGPQGTLFGRNATSGVINFITAKPDLTRMSVSGQFEYGNYDSKKAQAVVNLPLGDTFGLRVAGLYLKRDGYTRNLFDNSRIDDRDLYQVRATLLWEPSDATSISLLGSYFREDDRRSRIQKQLCNRDATGVLGCSPDRLENETVNANSTFAGLLSSNEFFAIGVAPAFAPFGIRSLYGPDAFSQFRQPDGVRTVNSNVNPTYFSDEINAQLRVDHDFGPAAFSLSAGYNRARVDSRAGYFLNVPDPLAGNAGIAAFRAPAPFNPLAPVLANGNRTVFDSAGNLCASDANRSYTGVFGGNTVGCFDRPYNYDRSRSTSEGYSVEAKINTAFDGPFNFLIGGIYLRGTTDGDYFVVQSEGNYVGAVIGAAQSLNPANGIAPGSVYFAPTFFNSETQRYRLQSYAGFGEAYFEASDALKFTLGLRYSRDEKFVRDRNPLLNFLVPYSATDATASPYVGAADFDASTPGNQLFREAEVSFGRLTGRAVVDFKPSENSLIFASYSRGYKSGGINPPFNPALFSAPATFAPETIDAFEIGTKNTFLGNTLQLNGSVFYYRYKDLQLSRILNRTSFNDNTDADIYGAEIEAVVRPARSFQVNLSASYLKSKIKDFSLVDTRDPSGGRSDVVIIKDITNAANCVVVPTAGGALASNTLVTAVNGAIGLRGPTPVAGTSTTGAFGVCSALASTIQNPSAPLRALFGVPTGPLPFVFNTGANGVATGLPDGVAVDLSGNELPNAPRYKFSAGAQHTLNFGNGMSLVTRGDLTYTGEYFSRSFNRPIDRIQGYEIVNASVQLNGPEQRWFVRGFVQNLTANDATTGQYVTDPSTGLFTNIFTLEPRRYGIAAGFSF